MKQKVIKIGQNYFKVKIITKRIGNIQKLTRTKILGTGVNAFSYRNCIHNHCFRKKDKKYFNLIQSKLKKTVS